MRERKGTRIGEGTIRIKRWRKQKRWRRRKKNDDAAGREPARLARQVQRARMQRYEATNSHNYLGIAELRPDFDIFRAREETHSLAIGMLATGRLTDVSVSYAEEYRRETHQVCMCGYMKLILVECNGNKKREKNAPFTFFRRFS